MVFRVPTHLESLIPPPASQIPNPADAVSSPWRGQFLVSGIRASDRGSNVEIRITGAETDGDTQSHLWPRRFIFSVASPHALPILPQLQHYLRNRSPRIPLTTFMPDRIRDPDQNAVNQSHFRSLSQLLWDGKLVVIVPISISGDSSGRHGILLFPTEITSRSSSSNSRSVIFGAMFLTPTDFFPDFVSVHAAAVPTASFAHPYDSSLHRSPSPTFVGASTRGYEHHHNSLPYSSRPLLHDRRHSSQSVSPTSPTETHPGYRYASPVPAMNVSPQSQVPTYTQYGAYEASSQYSGYPSESTADPRSGYHYSSHRGSSTSQSHSGYGQ
ncbi:hypothetical protein GYMLUDRAFT_241845 [Collybiopsis luxurians FD-317 M1]|uniref:Uncharacterized protein n=1 Tax=Collybiopsis luxurians FD-317 M1 TaxID=944289 RepID=A0A0D0CUT7_9AGAR|nr:hypothetical protein GYMLUDRAFT_241845 [Collybiopsis luxurians FD-317 M1]